MKHRDSRNTLHQQVLDLRCGHSLRQVSDRTGLPLGTVKTICSRSGAFRDNQALRELFRLPPIQSSAGTALTVPELPPQTVVTGDKEIDAVLWLREVIRTGQAALIEKAMQAAKLIKTPLREVGDRYLKHLVSQNPGNWTVAFQTMGFDDLETLAKRSIEKLTKQHEAVSRFGSVERLFEKAASEEFCIEALAGLKFDPYSSKDHAKIGKRFIGRPDLMPHTLSDCLYELAYWSELYWLRHAADSDAGDHWAEVDVRTDFIFRTMAKIRPKSKPEAVAVLRYLIDKENMDREETESILRNLIG